MIRLARAFCLASFCCIQNVSCWLGRITPLSMKNHLVLKAKVGINAPKFFQSLPRWHIPANHLVLAEFSLRRSSVTSEIGTLTPEKSTRNCCEKGYKSDSVEEGITFKSNCLKVKNIRFDSDEKLVYSILIRIYLSFILIRFHGLKLLIYRSFTVYI